MINILDVMMIVRIDTDICDVLMINKTLLRVSSIVEHYVADSTVATTGHNAACLHYYLPQVTSPW